MGLLSMYRDAAATIREERDERIELIRLRRARLELATTTVVAVVGAAALLAWPGLPDRARATGLAWLLAGTYVAWVLARVVARHRHGSAGTPELWRADALRNLLLLPVNTVGVGLLYWLLGRDLTGAVTFAVILFVALGVGLGVRYRRYSAQV